VTQQLARQKLRVVRDAIRKRSPQVARKLSKTTGSTPNRALVLSAAKYYLTLKKLAKT
jgi:hypothetical protein